MQKSLSFYGMCNPYGTTKCQQEEQNVCAPRRDLNGNLSLIRLAPYISGEHEQNRIEDDNQDHDQNASQQDPTPVHLRELGFHVYNSCLIEVVCVGPIHVAAGITTT